MLQGLLESLPTIDDISPPSGRRDSGAAGPRLGAMPTRAYLAPITRLPTETLDEIIAFASSEARLALLLVSRLVSALTLRRIYGTLALHSRPMVAKCCKTLLQNPLAASSVRELEISYPPSALLPLRPFYTLVGRALQRLTNIHRLSLLVSDPQFAAVLTTETLLPHLVHFNSQLSLFDPSVVEFLTRHRRISYLQLNAHSGWPPAAGPDATTTPATIPTIPNLTLPRLEYFSGNSASLAPVLGQHTSTQKDPLPVPLRAAFITWDDASSPTPQLAALERSCTDTLNFLACRRQGWNIDLLDRISTHLPHIYALSLTNLFVNREEDGDGGHAGAGDDDEVGFLLPPANLSAIGLSLARFSCLERLIISCVNVWYPWEIGVLRMDEAFDTVTAWGAICPSLLECTLPQSNAIRWLRICDNLWLPDLSDAGRATGRTGIRWLWERLRAGTYPRWDRVVARFACSAAKTKTLLRLRAAALEREYDSDSEGEDAPVLEAVRGFRLAGAGWSGLVGEEEDGE